jgi:hypothetical protein
VHGPVLRCADADCSIEGTPSASIRGNRFFAGSIPRDGSKLVLAGVFDQDETKVIDMVVLKYRCGHHDHH